MKKTTQSVCTSSTKGNGVEVASVYPARLAVSFGARHHERALPALWIAYFHPILENATVHGVVVERTRQDHVLLKLVDVL